MPKHLTTLEIVRALSQPDSRDNLLLSWPTTKCCIDSHAATGLWICQFSSQSPPYVRSEIKTLCAACGLYTAYKKWNGFMSPKLLRIDLYRTISAPEGDKRSPADKLIELISAHPAGEGYLRAWRLMFKPANLHFPIAPAFDTLQAIHGKLFPPADNKVD